MCVYQFIGKFRLEGPSRVSAQSRMSSEARPSYTGLCPACRKAGDCAAHLESLFSWPSSRAILLSSFLKSDFLSRKQFFLKGTSGVCVIQPRTQSICRLSKGIEHCMAYVISYEPWYHKGKSSFSFVTDMEKSSLLSNTFILWKLLI